MKDVMEIAVPKKVGVVIFDRVFIWLGGKTKDRLNLRLKI